MRKSVREKYMKYREEVGNPKIKKRRR